VPVIKKQNGALIGRVQRVVYIPGEKSLSGLTVSLGRRSKLLPAGHITCVAKEFVLADALPERGQDKTRAEYRVLDAGGRYIGRVRHVLFDEHSLAVKAVELVRGLLQDMREGTLWIEKYDALRIIESGKALMLGEE